MILKGVDVIMDHLLGEVLDAKKGRLIIHLLSVLYWTHGIWQVSFELVQGHGTLRQVSVFWQLGLVLLNTTTVEVLSQDTGTFSVLGKIQMLFYRVYQLTDLIWPHWLDGKRVTSGPEQICADSVALNSSNPIDKRLELRSRLLIYSGRVYQMECL